MENIMTIKECQQRIRRFKRMLEDIELQELAITRSIAIEKLNIAKLKVAEKKNEDNTDN